MSQSDLHPNVLAHLELGRIGFRVWRHADMGAPVTSPRDFSQLSGIPLSRITKTVLFQERGNDQRLVLANAPILCRLDLKAVSATLGYEALRVAAVETLTALLSYPPSGVSPLGVPQHIPILIDREVLKNNTVTVGGGRAGVEVELDPAALVSRSGAAPCDIRQP